MHIITSVGRHCVRINMHICIAVTQSHECNKITKLTTTEKVNEKNSEGKWKIKPNPIEYFMDRL